MISFDSRYPSIDDLRKKAKSKIPRFAFEYLSGGCNEDVNISKNTAELRGIELVPHYIAPYSKASLKTELFGKRYDAPFGIAPVGLQGLMWPNAPEILASASVKHNVPFILSTVTTSSIERIAQLTNGKAWFQLYHPADNNLRDNILERLKDCEYDVLVLLCDVPSFGFRPRDIRNGLSMPPKMSMKNILQIMQRPEWALKTLIHGKPSFETLKPYMRKGMNMKQLGQFMDQTFSGRMNAQKISSIRDIWKGKLVLKGAASEEDCESAVKLGLDGVIVSNHGGRQLDAGQSSIKSLIPIAKKYCDRLKVMMDSGIQSGPDIARAMACGAEFTFLGKSFMYGVSALGRQGGNHTISLLKKQLTQVLEQVGCENPHDLPRHLFNGVSRK